jgi:small subunit ribosomal protein S7
MIDSVAPLFKIRQQKGAAGGGKALPIPIPLAIRQRRRVALKWIIDASEKRRDPELPQRLVNEIVAIAEGRSSVWEKRAMVHRLATSARVNVMWTPQRAGGSKKKV